MKIDCTSTLAILSLVSLASCAVTLTPESVPAIKEDEYISQDTSSSKDQDNWYILPDNSNLICDRKTGKVCHPVDFIPETNWKQILPLQIIPTGLNIRMNLETGLKEAKLNEPEILENEVKKSSSDVGVSEVHEFTAIFENLKNNKDSENALEELIDFSHDYKHGSKIIHKEQKFIIDQIKSKNTSPAIAELYLRLITSCLRNNPPAQELFFTKNVDFLIEKIPEWIEDGQDILLKRTINILQNVAYKSSANLDLINNLEQLYTYTTDKDNKIKILEIFADLESFTTSDPKDLQFHFNPAHKSLIKRNLESKPNLESWFREYCEKIQHDTLDDFYVKKFMETLQKFKEEDPTLKPEKAFINWIASESMRRFNQLQDNEGEPLEKRDLDKEDFDKEFIRMRHEVFGNKLGARNKMPLDEL